MKQKLCSLGFGKKAVTVSIDTEKLLKNRLYDIGLTEGTPVEVLHESPSGDPRAYLIRGAVIALRNADAAQITVEPVAEYDE